MTRGILGAMAVAALFLLAPPMAAADEATPPGTAAFTYDLGARAAGNLDGACEARAHDSADGRPGLLEPRGAWYTSLRRVDAWVNYTLIGTETGSPVRHQTGMGRTEKVEAVLGQDLMVAWSKHGRASILEFGALRGATSPFHARFTADALLAGPSVSTGGAGTGWASPNAGDSIEVRRHIGGWSREVALEGGATTLEGNMSIYLEDAQVSDGTRSTSTGPYLESTRTGGPGAVLVSDHYRYAWLDLRGAELLAPEGGTLYCAGLALRVDGVYSASGAEGRVRRGDQEVGFGRRELTLLGAFEVRETHEPLDPKVDSSSPVHADAEGRFDAVALDFTVRAGGGGPAWATAVAATAGGLALAALAVLLYSRINEDHLLDRPERRALYETVVANPGIEFARILEANPMSATNARYHLKLLERRGLLKVVDVQGRHHYVPAAYDANRTQRALLLEQDPKLRDLLALLTAEGRSASELVDSLRQKWGLSRAGGWKVLDRAVRAHLVERHVTDRRVILRPAAS